MKGRRSRESGALYQAFSRIVRYVTRECDERNNPACHAGEEGLLSTGRERFAGKKGKTRSGVHSAGRPNCREKLHFVREMAGRTV